MESHFYITYEVVDPGTQKTEFVTEDRFIAESHYEKGYSVYEKHTNLTGVSSFATSLHQVTLCWHDEDENLNQRKEM